jgi:energy-coupling factor transport system permease protein
MMGAFDPRARVLFYLCFTTTVLLTQDWRVLAGLAALGVLIFLAARVSRARSKRVIIGALVFLSITSLLSLLFRTRIEAAQQALRGIAMTASALAIMLTFDASQLGVTFKRLGLPDRFAYLLDLTLRFIPTLTQDFTVTRDAQRARGLELETRQRGIKGLVDNVRRTVPLMVPVIVRAVLDAEDRANAMDMRAFGTQPRTWVMQLRYRAVDFFVIALGLAGLAAAIWWRIR